jgi:hypothetical protein
MVLHPCAKELSTSFLCVFWHTPPMTRLFLKNPLLEIQWYNILDHKVNSKWKHHIFITCNLDINLQVFNATLYLDQKFLIHSSLFPFLLLSQTATTPTCSYMLHLVSQPPIIAETHKCLTLLSVERDCYKLFLFHVPSLWVFSRASLY